MIDIGSMGSIELMNKVTTSCVEMENARLVGLNSGKLLDFQVEVIEGQLRELRGAAIGMWATAMKQHIKLGFDSRRYTESWNPLLCLGSWDCG